jgi:thiamine biosynthesis protein ThiS
MIVTVNGKKTDLTTGDSVIALLDLLGYKKSRSSVWVNGTQLLAAEYDTYTLSPGDEVRAIRLFSGG